MRGLAVLAAAGAVWVVIVGVPPLRTVRLPHIRLRVVALAIVTGVVGMAVAIGFLGTPAPALAIGILCAAVPARLEQSRTERVVRDRTDRWPDVVAHARSSVAAGATLPDAFIDACDRAGDDFSRYSDIVRHEVTFGGGFEPAMQEIRRDLDDAIADRVLATFAIAHHTGGRRVGHVLGTLGTSVAEEIRLRKAHDAALTEQRWTATVALIAPWVLLSLSIATNPQAAEAFETSEGILVVIGGLVATTVGWLLARRASKLSAAPRIFG